MINQKVKTPLGDGIDQGRFAVLDGLQNVVAVQKLVRLVINDETVKHLKDANCLTPHATQSGLWTFNVERED
jgi:hypothetical protein